MLEDGTGTIHEEFLFTVQTGRCGTETEESVAIDTASGET
jgi:hypothetical protein